MLFHKVQNQTSSCATEKQVPKISYTSAMMKWHCEIREGLEKTGSNRPFDPKWGRYTPDKWFNVDQVPLPFAIDRKTTYQESCAGREKRGSQGMGGATCKWLREAPVLIAGLFQSCKG